MDMFKNLVTGKQKYDSILTNIHHKTIRKSKKHKLQKNGYFWGQRNE